MLIVISPSKGQDFKSDYLKCETTVPAHLKDSEILIKELKKLSPIEIKKLMNVSEKIAELNYQRYQDFNTPFNDKNARPCFFAFTGDVYSGFSKPEYTLNDLSYAQEYLRILSGLYGVLKPLDLIQAYRLEMKTKLVNPNGKDLYQFWDNKITENLNHALKNKEYLLNLASNEYFKAVKQKLIKSKIINFQFKEVKNGQAKIISVFAKKARGLMSDFIIRERINKLEDIKNFNSANYEFSKKESDNENFVFTRAQPKNLNFKP